MFRILARAAQIEAAWKAMQKEEFGYESFTTFYSDFTIADAFGAKAVKDTYKRCVKSWLGDYKYATELVLVLNHKSWEHHGAGNMDLSALYSDLYYELKDKFYDKYENNKEAREYFFNITD